MAYENSMYCKLFKSLYQGTLRGRSHEILVFTNLLAHADKNGHVDSHFRAIADEVGLTIDEVKKALEVLEGPDEESRSPEEDGRRIVRLDEHRIWGWRIVNYAKYREIRNDDDRKEQNRLAQERWRKKRRGEISLDKPESAQAEVNEEVKERSIYSLEFDEFWKSYPKKKAKADAWRAWQKSKTKPSLEIILKSILAQSSNQDWKKENGQYIPLPASWINGARWDDELTSKLQTKKPHGGIPTGI